MEFIVLGKQLRYQEKLTLFYILYENIKRNH